MARERCQNMHRLNSALCCILCNNVLSENTCIWAYVIFDGNSHPSILKIKNNTQHNTLFDFKPTDIDTINKLVSKINIKKATVVDQISSKLLRAGAPVLNKHITTLVNNTVKTSVFPTRLKGGPTYNPIVR